MNVVHKNMLNIKSLSDSSGKRTVLSGIPADLIDNPQDDERKR